MNALANRAIISVINDLQSDQRVARVCGAMHEAGYEILLVGRLRKSSEELTRPYPVKRMRLFFERGFAFYAEYNLRLLMLLLARQKDLLYANDLDTLLPNFLISKLFRIPLVYDSHEYFTEVPELIDRPAVRSFWLRLERLVFPRLRNVITVNAELSGIYHRKYGIRPKVIRNVPDPVSVRPGTQHKENVSGKAVLLYQGALNEGRGIELMIDSMELLNDCILVIAGEGDISSDLEKRSAEKGLTDRVLFKGRMAPENLRELTLEADLGFSLEEDLGLNYRYALPNKIFDYIHAGIPVIASDLPVMRDLVLESRVGEVLRDRTPSSLATLVRRIISDRESYRPHLEAAAREFTWNKEKAKLLELLENLE